MFEVTVGNTGNPTALWSRVSQASEKPRAPLHSAGHFCAAMDTNSKGCCRHTTYKRLWHPPVWKLVLEEEISPRILQKKCIIWQALPEFTEVYPILNVEHCWTPLWSGIDKCGLLKKKTVRNSSILEAADALCIGMTGIGTAVYIEVT